MLHTENNKLLICSGSGFRSNCCPPCNCALTNKCPVCFDPNVTPSHYQVTVAGLRWCSDDSLITEFNKVHCLSFYFTNGVYCEWNKFITIGAVSYRIFTSLNPGVPNCLFQIEETVSQKRLFYDSKNYTTGDINYVNDWAIGHCGIGAPLIIGYGGTAALEKIC